MKCPACGAAKLVRDTRDLSHTYKGETTTIPDVTGQFCPACDEAVLDADESARVKSSITIAVQVNGKLRANIQAAPGAGEQDVLDLALAGNNVQRHVEGKTIRKVIVVPKKLVNIVAT